MDNNIYQSFGNDINNNNIVAGSQLFCNNENCPEYAVVFSINNTPTNITPNGFAYGINNLNYVVGRSFENGFDPFFWNGNALTNLPEPPGANHRTYAIKINDNNYIIGRSQIGNNSIPVYWINQQLIVPQMPVGLEQAVFIDINSQNQILGDGGLPLGAFIYEDDNVKLLKDLIPQDSGWEILSVQDIIDKGVILAQGRINGISKQVFLVPSFVKNPSAYDKWIAGETDTIKWTETSWLAVNIKCITNIGTPIESEIILTTGNPIADSKFVWEIPDSTLSFRTKIVIENANDTSENLESDIFRIKPYVLTKVKDDSTYHAYDITIDRWGFGNTDEDIWPSAWYNQFNYQGVDPISGYLYPQWSLDSLFYKAKKSDYPDWVSWVNTFGTTACYINLANGVFNETALLKWKARKGKWAGSCFGFAITNALAFEKKSEFLNTYSGFPNFVFPIGIGSNNNTIPVINELFTHQYGNPHWSIYQNVGLTKTPNQTIGELREMLKEDNAQIRTISFINNAPGGSGAHAILAYGLEKDEVDPDVLDILVYDNSYSDDLTAEIEVDTSLNAWVYSNWANWGGQKWLFLEDLASTYLQNPALNKNSSNESPFILADTILQIFNPINASIQIIDNQGRSTGYFNNSLTFEIPNAYPFIVRNGSEQRPIGYTLSTNRYTTILKDFSEDTLEAFFFTGNKSFSYERDGASQTQTDKLFFDGGVSVSNPDAQTKSVKLLNLINETEQEKLTVLRSIDLAQNDSVKIENPDSNKVKLISYGSAKDYDIELNYVTENGIGRFGDFNIPLSANTSHIFVPNWIDLTNSQLTVFVDINNDGTIDDTLYLNNTVDVEDQGSLIVPDEYQLAQNYPNPFNPTTTIQYSIPITSNVSLKIYDILGNEVATLVNEEKNRGVYTVKFDASQYSSGIYFYKLHAGSFVETKKMILIR